MGPSDRFPFSRQSQTAVGTDELLSPAWPRTRLFAAFSTHSQTRQRSSQTCRSVTSGCSHLVEAIGLSQRVCAATICAPLSANKPEKKRKIFPRWFINNLHSGGEFEFVAQNRELGRTVRTNMTAVHPCQPITVQSEHKPYRSNADTNPLYM